MHTIEVRHLSKHFGTLKAVDDVSFSVDRGDVLGFLGPNGAGKSTTMKMVTGFLTPSSGSVSVCGHDISAEPVRVKANLGYLPEGAPLYGEMTPAGFLDFIAEVRGLSGPMRRSRIDGVVARIHLEGVMHQRIETLSKGYKRRVGLAQALLHDPEVLVLDEPTDGLDPNQKHEVRTLIQEMAPEKAIVISTHILEEVDAVCSRAIIIGRGRLLFSGTPVELAARSRYRNAVSLHLKAAVAEAACRRLLTLKEVKEVQEIGIEDGIARLIAFPKKGQSIIAEVSELCRTSGWEVGELHAERGHLDEVFRTITAGALEGSAGAAHS